MVLKECFRSLSSNYPCWPLETIVSHTLSYVKLDTCLVGLVVGIVQNSNTDIALGHLANSRCEALFPQGLHQSDRSFDLVLGYKMSNNSTG